MVLAEKRPAFIPEEAAKAGENMKNAQFKDKKESLAQIREEVKSILLRLQLTIEGAGDLGNPDARHGIYNSLKHLIEVHSIDLAEKLEKIGNTPESDNFIKSLFHFSDDEDNENDKLVRLINDLGHLRDSLR